MKSGVLYGVGVGPGDPELLTLKAVRIVSDCDAVCFPGNDTALAFEIACSGIPAIGSKEQIPLELPMTRDEERLQRAWETSAARIMDMLQAGKNVAFLTLGDVSIYSTFGYLRRIVEKQGYETRAVPGVTSFCAAAAALGEDLVLREEPLHIIPASYPDVPAALRMGGTRVLMKAGTALPAVRSLLEEQGLADATGVVENCGMTGEKVWKRITDMGDEKPGYFTVLIIKEAQP